jgi:hypothetical protein
VSFVLTAIGTLLLLLSLAAICFGVFMAMDPKNRDAGRFFAVWWIPAAAAASGVLMRDVVTFAVGLFCFLIAGATFATQGGIGRDTVGQRTRESRRSTTGETKKDEDRAAS